MGKLAASLLVVAVNTSGVFAADSPAAPLACEQTRAPIRKDAPGLAAYVRRSIDAYREAWRRVCELRRDRVDLAELLGDAEALTSDVALSRGVRALAEPDALGSPAWPFPGLLLAGSELAVDWSALASVADRGSAEDARFWRAVATVADGLGQPSWIEEDSTRDGGQCIRLGAVSWLDVANAIGDMADARSQSYARHAERLRLELVRSIESCARGPVVCGCVKGDPSAGLAPLAALTAGRAGTPARRELAKSAAAALDALAAGRVKVVWAREKPEAPGTGCAAIGR